MKLLAYWITPILLLSHYYTQSNVILGIIIALSIVCFCFYMLGASGVLLDNSFSAKSDAINIAKNIKINLTPFIFCIGIVYQFVTLVYLSYFACYFTLVFYLISILSMYFFMYVTFKNLNDYEESL